MMMMTNPLTKDGTADYYSVTSKLSRFKEIIFNKFAYYIGYVLLWAFLLLLIYNYILTTPNTEQQIKRIEYANSRKYRRKTPPG